MARITLNRPDKYNAIDRTMAAELLAAFRRVRDEAGMTVVVLARAGPAFCTGGELSIFPSLADHTAGLDWPAYDGYEIGKAVELCEKVVIAEINLGLLPGWGGTVRIARAMPLHRAREIIYSGRKDYTARDFYEMGLLTRVFDADRFEERFAEIVANIAGKNAGALRMGKRVLARSLETPSLDAALAMERNAVQWLSHAPEIQAALAAFRQDPDALVRSQRAANIGADQGA